VSNFSSEVIAHQGQASPNVVELPLTQRLQRTIVYPEVHTIVAFQEEEEPLLARYGTP
jgi:hypothetical protein